MFERDVQTRSQYLKQINRAGAEDLGEEEELIVPNMDKAEVTMILRQDCEERAALLYETFFKSTSVMFDHLSMVAILKREDLDQTTLETVANLLFISLVSTS